MIITQTPLRISFLGGGTDFPEYYQKYGGLVLTSTINKYIYCIVKKRFDDLIYIDYSQKEIVDNVNDIKHDLVREAMKMTGITKGIEISFLSDIPTEGSGLGSSSAVTVGVLNALHAYKGEYVMSEYLAKEAVLVELGLLRKHIGIQDQYAVALGGLRYVEFDTKHNIKSLKTEIESTEDFNNSLMLFYTGVTRKANDVLATFDPIKNKKHLDRVKMLTEQGLELLEKDDLKKFGHKLDEYWNLKKEMNANTTNSQIDEMYKLALDAGADGGKVIGAGGGGFLLVMFPAGIRSQIRKALNGYKELPFRFSDSGSKIILNI